ncbi:MAG: SprT family zinc-dependent metalloprotease [Pseudomonadota bacterium]
MPRDAETDGTCHKGPGLSKAFDAIAWLAVQRAGRYGQRGANKAGTMGEERVLSDATTPVTVRRSARARRLSLRVSRLDGRVTLTMPQGIPVSEGLSFAEERLEWIAKARADVVDQTIVAVGATVPIEGAEVAIVAGDGRRIGRDGDRLLVRGAHVGRTVQTYLKALARDRLAAASDLHSAALGVGYRRLTLRDTRSRWGSCTSQGNLMYSWRLVMAPPAVLDYVAAHEVAHLVHMDHSPRFWSVVADRCPDWRVHRDWLRIHGAGLHRYSFDD